MSEGLEYIQTSLDLFTTFYIHTFDNFPFPDIPSLFYLGSPPISQAALSVSPQSRGEEEEVTLRQNVEEKEEEVKNTEGLQ